MPDLLALKVDQAIGRAGYPGSKMIPPTQAILALLAGKLLGKRRINHIDDLNFDAGAGLFAGLNVLPKTTYATDYSYRTQRAMNESLVDALLARLAYGHRGRRLRGFETATPSSLYRKFINTPGRVEIAEGQLNVIFEKRSHNPILVEAGFERPTPPTLWCGGLRLRMLFP